MAREHAEVETLIHSVERNHRLRRAQPRETPREEPPDRPGRRVRFADPLVAHDHHLFLRTDLDRVVSVADESFVGMVGRMAKASHGGLQLEKSVSARWILSLSLRLRG